MERTEERGVGKRKKGAKSLKILLFMPNDMSWNQNESGPGRLKKEVKDSRGVAPKTEFL